MTLIASKVAVSGVVGFDQGLSDWAPLETGTALIDDLPAGMGARPEVLMIRPHEVEAGDFLDGLPLTAVESLLFDGASCRWLYFDDRGVRFASRMLGERVQVVRGVRPARRVRVLRVVR